jgi:ABC-2 type transport system permease protein
MRLLWAFLRRDVHEELSYRLSFLLSLSSILFSAFTFFFLSEAFGSETSEVLSSYDTDYFSFVLVGMAFNSYFAVGLNGFAGGIRRAQTTGTLEAMLMSPTPLSIMVIGSAMWSYVFTTFRMMVYLGLGAALGVSFRNANVLGALVSLILAVISFASLGIMAASVIMVIKRGDPITSLISYVTLMLGGIYYPIEVLPDWLQTISKLLPITYAINAMRQALLNGAGWDMLRPNLLILLAFSLVLAPLALLVFRYAVERARDDGSLTHY